MLTKSKVLMVRSIQLRCFLASTSWSQSSLKVSPQTSLEPASTLELGKLSGETMTLMAERDGLWPPVPQTIPPRWPVFLQGSQGSFLQELLRLRGFLLMCLQSEPTKNITGCLTVGLSKANQAKLMVIYLYHLHAALITLFSKCHFEQKGNIFTNLI